MSLMLSWLLFFEAVKVMSVEQRGKVTASLKESGTTNPTLSILVELFLKMDKVYAFDVAKALGDALLDLRAEMPLDLLALRTFHAALAAIPALVRQWLVYDCRRQVQI